MDEYEQQITRTIEQKRKAEENCNVFLELQKKIQKDLEDTNGQLLEIKKSKEELEDRVKDYWDEIISLKNQLDISSDKVCKLSFELDEANKKNKEEKEYKLQVENQSKYLQEENLLIKEEVRLIAEENNKLKAELDLERNQSVMERLLRRKTSSSQNNF